jgi:hypothetical protein
MIGGDQAVLTAEDLAAIITKRHRLRSQVKKPHA